MSDIIVYAAGPIDAHVDANWREMLTKRLEDAAVPAVIFDPSTAYKTSLWGKQCLERARYIEAVNKAALQEADIFIAHIPAGAQTIGTPIELDWAFQGAQEVMLLTNIPKGKSVYLDTHVLDENWFMYDDKITLEQAVDEAVLRMHHIYFDDELSSID